MLLRSRVIRCSQPLSTNQTPHPTTKAGQQHASHPTQGPGTNGPVVSGPNSVSGNSFLTGSTKRHPYTGSTFVVHPNHTHYRRSPSSRIAQVTEPPHTVGGPIGLVVLLRKEVIQPHLPVRLPCYDFVPIADPTFDGSLPQGVRPPASGVTDFHDVTGGVYKARERIHRSVADLRLLATPTSWGRVADPNPN